MLNVRFRTFDGAEGELMANPEDTVETILERLFNERTIVGNEFHRTPKQLLWKGKNICEMPSATLKDICFEDMGIINFVPFESVDDMMEAMMGQTKSLHSAYKIQLHHQISRGDALGHSLMRAAEQNQSLQIKRAKGNTYADYVKALAMTTESTEIPLSIVKACAGYVAGKTLPTGNFTLCSSSPFPIKLEGSALIPAICLHRLDVVEALLTQFQTSATSCDPHNRNALHYAVSFGSIGMVRLLTKSGRVSTHAPDNDQISPLLLAAQIGRTAELQVMMEENTSCTPAGVNRDGHGRSLLHLAALHGRVDTVNYLLSLIQTDIGAIDNEGNTALHLAAKAGHQPVVSVLLTWKCGTAGECNVNAVNRQGRTALHLAALNGRDNVVAELCKNGSRIHLTLPDFSKKASPVTLATENGHVRVVQILAKVANGVGYEEKELRACDTDDGNADAMKQCLLRASVERFIGLYSCFLQ